MKLGKDFMLAIDASNEWKEQYAIWLPKAEHISISERLINWKIS